MSSKQLTDPESLQSDVNPILGKTEDEKQYDKDVHKYDSRLANRYLDLKKSDTSSITSDEVPSKLKPDLKASSSSYKEHKNEIDNYDQTSSLPSKLSDFNRAVDDFLEDPVFLSLDRLDEETIRRGRKEVIQKSLKIVCDKMSAQTAAIFLYSKDGIFLERVGIYGFDKSGNLVGESGNSDTEEWYKQERYKVGDSFTGRAAEGVSGQDDDNDSSRYGIIQVSSDLISEDLNSETKKKYLEKFGFLRCGIAIPLNGRNKTFGVLRIINKIDIETKNVLSVAFTQDDIKYSLYLAANVANALSNFRRDIQIDIFKYLSRLQVEFVPFKGKPNLVEICNQVLNLLVKNPETPFAAGVLRMRCDRDDGSEVLEPVVSFAPHVVAINDRNNSPRKRDDYGFLWLVADERKRLILDNIQDENVISEFTEDNRGWIRSNNFQSFGCFPLIVCNNTVGTLSLYTGHNYEFDAEIVEFLQGIVNLTASLFDRALASLKVEARFKELYRAWKDETKTVSFSNRRAIYPSYQQIIGLGPDAIPFMLKNFSEETNHWFWALRAIAGEDAVRPQNRGNIQEMKKDWLNWGKARGYVLD